MRYRWLAALLCSIAVGYGVGAVAARLLGPGEFFGVRLGLIMGMFFVAALVAAGAAFRFRRGAVRWDRIVAEQRLWESGPLGRRWLAKRSRLSDRDPW